MHTAGLGIEPRVSRSKVWRVTNYTTRQDVKKVYSFSFVNSIIATSSGSSGAMASAREG